MRRYVGNAVESDRPNMNLDSLAFSSAEGWELAIARLVAWAEKAVEDRGVAAATLVLTEDGRGIGRREAESAKYALRP